MHCLSQHIKDHNRETHTLIPCYYCKDSTINVINILGSLRNPIYDQFEEIQVENNYDNDNNNNNNNNNVLGI